MDMKFLPTALRYLRCLAMLSPFDAVDRAGESWFTVEAVERWERGEKIPTFEQVVVIVETYRVGLTELQILCEAFDVIPPGRVLEDPMGEEYQELPNDLKCFHILASVEPNTVMARAAFQAIRRETMVRRAVVNTEFQIADLLFEAVRVGAAEP